MSRHPPTMLLTGEDDRRTPISETEQFYQALRLRGVDSAMIRLPDTSHGIASRPSRLITKVDHILSDVVSGPIGNLPKNSSAVNFGKGFSFEPNNSDLAAGVINMVAQTILRTAVMSAISSGVSEVVIIGRTPKYSLLSNILEEGFNLYNLNYDFVKDSEFAIALGTL